MKCLICKHCDLRANAEMSRIGFGKCAIDEIRAHSVSFLFERQCGSYEMVDLEAKIKREIWAEQLTAKSLAQHL